MRIAFCFAVMLGLSTFSSFGVAQEKSVKNLNLPQHGCSFAGNFEQAKHITGLADSLKSSGVFYYSCQHGVIWKTAAPITEAIIFKKNQTAFLLQGDTLKPLKSRPMKVLGRLLNSLIGGDVETLSELFSVSASEITDTENVTLMPRKQNLKRGLKQIELEYPLAASVDQKWVAISMLSRRDELTSIRATVVSVLDEVEAELELDLNLMLKQCTSIEALGHLACEQLFSSGNSSAQAKGS